MLIIVIALRPKQSKERRNENEHSSWDYYITIEYRISCIWFFIQKKWAHRIHLNSFWIHIKLKIMLRAFVDSIGVLHNTSSLIETLSRMILGTTKIQKGLSRGESVCRLRATRLARCTCLWRPLIGQLLLHLSKTMHWCQPPSDWIGPRHFLPVWHQPIHRAARRNQHE